MILNEYDINLVDEFTRRFNTQIEELPAGRSIKFKGDVYDSMYLFLNGEELRSPLEIYANDLDEPERAYDWVKVRKPELDKVVQHLMPQCQW